MLFRIKPNNGDTVAVPQLLFAKLGHTDEANFRVALYVLATGCTDAQTIANNLKLRSKQTAESALLWWAGAGLLEQYDDAAALAPEAPPPAALTWQEIAAASRTDPMVASLVECTQASFGRALSHGDLQKLVALYLQEGFVPETIMLCVSYLASKNKRTIAALRHCLKVWQADGVTTGEEADAYLQLLALRETREAFVATLLQIAPSELTLGGKKAIARWYESYLYDDSMVTEAAVQAGNKNDLWYLNGILKSWHSKGLRTVHEVRGGGAVSGAESRNIRIDRETPSGNDFLQNAMSRPRRLKRKE